MSYNQFDDIKMPFNQLDEKTQERLISWMTEGNSKEELVVTLLERYLPEELQSLVNDVNKEYEEIEKEANG